MIPNGLASTGWRESKTVSTHQNAISGLLSVVWDHALPAAEKSVKAGHAQPDFQAPNLSGYQNPNRQISTNYAHFRTIRGQNENSQQHRQQPQLCSHAQSASNYARLERQALAWWIELCPCQAVANISGVSAIMASLPASILRRNAPQSGR